jgi:hypothetical protein
MERINMHVSKMKSNEVNAKQCKALLYMIEEASEKGEYKLILNDDDLPENKMTYLRNLGYIVQLSYDGNVYKKTIRW